MTDPLTPDLSDRPYETRVVQHMRALPHALFESFTTGWDRWFAMPGGLLVDAVPQGRLFFVVEHQARRHPHYGRFLTITPDRRVELTWVTGAGGTEGAETVLSVDLAPDGAGGRVTLVHRGFYKQETADTHGASWQAILAHLDDQLTK